MGCDWLCAAPHFTKFPDRLFSSAVLAGGESGLVDHLQKLENKLNYCMQRWSKCSCASLGFRQRPCGRLPVEQILTIYFKEISVQRAGRVFGSRLYKHSHTHRCPSGKVFRRSHIRTTQSVGRCWGQVKLACFSGVPQSYTSPSHFLSLSGRSRPSAHPVGHPRAQRPHRAA